MTWFAVGTAVVGGVVNYTSQKKAAKASQKGDQAAIDEQRRQYDLTRQDMAPWTQNGGWAMNQLKDVNSGDYTGFMNSPDYLAARDEGMAGINRHLAAKGSYYSGGGDADRMKFLSGLATQNLGNYRSSLSGMAGLGQQSTTSLGQFGSQMSGNVSGLYSNMGSNRASSYLKQGDNIANTAGIIGGGLSQWMQQRKAGSY